jgi:hypothetical protein
LFFFLYITYSILCLLLLTLIVVIVYISLLLSSSFSLSPLWPPCFRQTEDYRYRSAALCPCTMAGALILVPCYVNTSTLPLSDWCLLSAIKQHFCVVNDAYRYSKVCGLLVPYCVMAGAADPHPVDCSTASPPHLTTSWKDGSLVFIHSPIHILWTFAFTFLSINFSYIFMRIAAMQWYSNCISYSGDSCSLLGDRLYTLKFPVSSSNQTLGQCLN